MTKTVHGPNHSCNKLNDALDRHTEAHWYLHQLKEYYHLADPFRYSLSSFIRALKEVPQIVQMQLQGEAGFKDFFAKIRATMEQDPLVTTLRRKRDFIVHRGMLLPESTVHVGAARGPGAGFKIAIGLPADPALDSDEVMADFVALCVKQPDLFAMFGPDVEQVGCIRRVWRMPEFPGIEIRVLAARAWKLVGDMLAGTLSWLGHEPVSFELPCLQDHLAESAMFRYYPRGIFEEQGLK